MSKKFVGLVFAAAITAAAVKVVRDILEADKQDKEIIELNKAKEETEEKNEPEA